LPEYFSWFLNSPLGFGQASDDVGGSASPHVNIRSIRRFAMPLPPTGEQARIIAVLEQLLAQVEQLAAAAGYRDDVACRFADAAKAAAVAP
jgi:type I restriction enzyme, S subunit